MTHENEATYCPEDNKIRLYCGRVPREEYLELRALGFKSTPKQDCDFVATWGIAREDRALSMLAEGDTIGDEDQSPADRAADRAERFAMYRDKRRIEAGGHADAFDAGPSSHGYQSQDRANRAAAKHDRHRGRALSQWDKAEYWQQRTAGVIEHAIYQTSASVRRGRIVRLESDLRTHTGDCYTRYRAHLENRLAYERQMLASQGGSAADVDIIPGGYFGRHQVIKVNRSPVTKQPVSVKVWGAHDWKRDANGEPLQCLKSVNIQRLGEDAYTPPTEADLVKLAEFNAALKEKTKEKNAGKPKLINPTDADAQRLQDTLNAAARGGSSEILKMTQAQYSARSKGSYSSYGAEFLHADGSTDSSPRAGRWIDGQMVQHTNICKVRIGPNIGSSSFYSADSVIIITDKPQKPLPAWSTVAEGVAS